MRVEMECPFCDTDFEGVEWTPGKCPGCGRAYDWDEQPLDDGDYWTLVDWEWDT